MHVHLTLFALLVGCSGGKDPEDTGPLLPPGIELGTGETEFEPLADGDEILIVFGPQGGYHFNVSMLVQGIDPGDPDDLDEPTNPTTGFYAFEAGNRVDMDVSTYKQGIDPVREEPGVFQMIGRRLILDITDDAQLDGATVRVDLYFEDSKGTVLEDTRTLVAIPHPLND